MEQNKAIETFFSQIAALNEADYGDFKRKAILYLVRLRSSLGISPRDVQKVLSEMETLLLYQPDADIASTQGRLLSYARGLKARFQENHL